MTIKNTSSKIIGFGEIAVLPGQVVEIPDSFNGSVVETYKNMGFIEVIVKEKTVKVAAKSKGKKEATDTEVTE